MRENFEEGEKLDEIMEENLREVAEELRMEGSEGEGDNKYFDSDRSHGKRDDLIVVDGKSEENGKKMEEECSGTYDPVGRRTDEEEVKHLFSLGHLFAGKERIKSKITPPAGMRNQQDLRGATVRWILKQIGKLFKRD